MESPKSCDRPLSLFLTATLWALFFLSPACRGEVEGRRTPSSTAQAVPGETDAAPGQSAGREADVLVTTNLDLDFSKHKVTFIELGADRCIPCKAMQPIMKEIAGEYAGKIQVVFYDVWKDPAPARKYGIQLIPTQVFIDQSGREIFRHVGLFPKAEILDMLEEKGIL
jgi:thioredoxin 1